MSRPTVRKVLRANSSEVPKIQRAEKAEPYREQILGLFSQEQAWIGAQIFHAGLSKPAAHLGGGVAVLLGVAILVANPGLAAAIEVELKTRSFEVEPTPEANRPLKQ